MKISTILRRAAVEMDRRGGRLFTVIGGYDDEPIHPGYRYFWGIFKEGEAEDWTKQDRVMGLLFAAAIAKSEGL